MTRENSTARKAARRAKNAAARKKPSSRSTPVGRAPKIGPVEPGLTLYKHLGRTVVRHGDLVIKHNIDMSPSEVTAMKYVRDHTSIPVPRVHHATDTTITMDFIEGDCLSDVWNVLPDKDKTAIKNQLRTYLLELHSIEGEYIGLFDKEPAKDVRRDCASGGPFYSESDFNKFLLSNVTKSCPAAIREMVSTQLKSDHKIVLTHGDLVPQNILVKGGIVVGIIDWEFSGWYPEYWDLIMIFRGSRWNLGYFNEAIGFFPGRYDHEYLVDQMLGRISSH